MTGYELELLKGINRYLNEIVVEIKKTNNLLGGICSVADKSFVQPAIDTNVPFGATSKSE